MPRASWRGFLRFSLVSCPVYLAPAVTEANRTRFNQLNPVTGNRVRQLLVDQVTGESVERDHVVKGYEHQKGSYVQVTQEELDSLKVESTHVVDLEAFVAADEVDRLYLDHPYWVYPDGQLAHETFRVVGAALTRSGQAGLGRVTIAGRERPVLVEPRSGGLLMTTLRSPEEVRVLELKDSSSDHPDSDMVAVAQSIVERRRGTFDPANFRDRYQDALRELVQLKLAGAPVPASPPTFAAASQAPNLMDALKRSLAQETAPVQLETASRRARPPKEEVAPRKRRVAR